MKNSYLKLIYKILAIYARRVIKKHDPFVIAITGSVGKTSTKEAVYQVMKDKYGDEVRRNEGNLNAEIGIPLTILGYDRVPNKFIWPFFLILAYFRSNIKKYPQYLVLEFGVEHKGDINYFCSIARPDIAIITSTSKAHTANFRDHQEFIDEKISIINHLKKSGKAIVNFDDSELAKLDKNNIFSIGIKSKSVDFRAEDIKLSLTGTEYRISSTGHKISVKTKLLGDQMIYPSLFAFAVGSVLNFPLIETGKSLEKILPIPGRLNSIEGKDGISIIDDTYNSNPASLRLAIDFLSKVEYKGRRVVILGNMNELGRYEKLSHREAGAYCRGKCDLAVFVGPNAMAMKEKFGDDGLTFVAQKDLLNKIEEIVKPKDLILVKASQNNNYFEEIVKVLMKCPEKAEELLVRQGKFWRRKK